MAIDSMNNTATSTLSKNSSQQFTVDKWAAEKTAEASKKTASGANPNGQLDKDAFLKLLLAELQHQDPTSPMDTAAMLEQTSQLSMLETQQNTNEVMQKIASQMQSSSSMTAMSALGKMAEVNYKMQKGDTDTNMSFNLSFEEAANTANIEIYNAQNEVVQTISANNVSKGLNSFTWDGTNKSGAQAPAGDYTARVTYKTADGKTKTSSTEKYPVEAVKFSNGAAQVKINGKFVDISSVSEFTDKA